MEKQLATFEDFSRLDIRVGTILTAQPFPQGPPPGLPAHGGFRPGDRGKKSSAQITDHYRPEDLPGIQVLGGGQLPAPADRGFYERGTGAGYLLRGRSYSHHPQQPAANGDRLG